MSTTNRSGQFVWRELLTTDVEAATRFYSEVFGWRFERSPEYAQIHLGEKALGGVMKIPAAATGMPPSWSSYVTVPDVDAAAKTVQGAGGRVLVPPQDIPRVGRFAAVMDPQGAYFNVFKYGSAEEAARPAGMPGVGEFCWETLSTTDVEGAKAFYAKVTSWKAGTFHGSATFEAESGAVADIQKTQPGVPTHWLSYVVVADRAAALDRVKRLGGAVHVERIDVPEVGAIAVIADPQGAALGILEAPKR